MKGMLMGGLWVLCSLAGRAQLLSGFFDQNATRKQENEQQITALGTFITVAEKGYGIVESGLSTITGLKTGEFNLHSTFYSSLSSVNPSIGNMGEVAEIVALQVATVERVNSALSRYRQNGVLGADEVTAVSQVLQVVLNAAISDVGMLIQIITPGKLQMTDDQRMGRIRDLDTEARARYVTVAGVTDQADLLSLQRQAAAADIGTVQGLYGVP